RGFERNADRGGPDVGDLHDGRKGVGFLGGGRSGGVGRSPIHLITFAILTVKRFRVKRWSIFAGMAEAGAVSNDGIGWFGVRRGHPPPRTGGRYCCPPSDPPHEGEGWRVAWHCTEPDAPR